MENKPHSASSLKLYLGCPRRWVFERIHGFQEPETNQKTLGKDVHAEMEAWVKEGKLPTHPVALKLLGLFKGHPFFPGKGTTEAEEHFTMTIQGVSWHGYTDWRRQKVIGSRDHIVGDWKTSNDLKYALREERGLLVDSDGKIDPQSTLYATREFVEGATTVTGHWAYAQSKAPYASRLVEVLFDRSAAEDAYGHFHGKALEMGQLFQIRPKANDVPYNPGYCRAFNRPCEQTERCTKSSGLFIVDPLSTAQGAEVKDFLNTMMSTFPTDGVDDDAPPPPPVEEDEAPPPPPDEDCVDTTGEDIPPPPPEDDEIEAEKLVAEYMASKRPPKAPPDEVEAGFVNAPEAKGKKPYATPEEAAVGEGVVAVLDEAHRLSDAVLTPATKTKKSRAKKANKAVEPAVEAAVATEAQPFQMPLERLLEIANEPVDSTDVEKAIIARLEAGEVFDEHEVKRLGDMNLGLETYNYIQEHCVYARDAGTLSKAKVSKTKADRVIAKIESVFDARDAELAQPPIREEFAVHMLNEKGVKAARALGGEFSRLLDQLEELCGKDGREMAIVRTKLQEASFMAKRAIAVRPENQL